MADAPNKILITGPLGYVGGALIPHLKHQFPEAYLIGVDEGWFSQCTTTNAAMPEALLDRLVLKDVRNLTEDDLHGVSTIVHLAAVSNDPMGKTFEAATRAINFEATIDLARKARDCGVGRFVFASSCSVYGAGPDEAVDEAGRLNPLTAYAMSKVDSEEALNGLAHADFMVTCLRFGTACGFSPRTRLDLVVNDFVASAVSRREIRLLSTGTAWRPFIHIEDMARAIEWAIVRDGLAIEIVNVGSDKMTTRIKDLAVLVGEIVASSNVVIADGANDDARTYRVSFDRFKTLAPDHQPCWSMAETIRQLYDGFRAIEFDDSDFRQGPLIRLNALRRLLDIRAIDSQLLRMESTVA